MVSTGLNPLPSLKVLLLSWPLIIMVVVLPFWNHPQIETLSPLFLRLAKLFSMILLSHAFGRITPPNQVKSTLQWIFRPLGLAFAYHMGTMAGLVFTFLPQLFQQISKIREAALIRGMSLRRHPLRWIKVYSFPLLLKFIIRSQTMADSMTCRHHGLHYCIESMPLSKKLFFQFFLLTVLFAPLVLTNYIPTEWITKVLYP